MTANEIADFWGRYLKSAEKPAETTCKESFYFGYYEELADELLQLVLAGQKTATTSSYLAYANVGEALPKVGDLSIVTDWSGRPACVIENTQVVTLPFNQMTFDLCRLEGEDENLASWQENHRQAFTHSGPEEGYVFSEEMPVVFEVFRVVYREV